MRLGDLDDLKKAVEEQRKPKVYSEADERQNIIVDCILYIIDNAPTVIIDWEKSDAYLDCVKRIKSLEKENDELRQFLKAYFERPQGDLADEVWELYEKHHSHLATHVIEFGDELKDLLVKYQKGGAE